MKPTYLKNHGHTVINPALPDDDMEEAVLGAVAMNINSGEAKLVLVCPAWRKYGTAKTVKRRANCK